MPLSSINITFTKISPLTDEAKVLHEALAVLDTQNNTSLIGFIIATYIRALEAYVEGKSKCDYEEYVDRHGLQREIIVFQLVVLSTC